MDVQLNYLAILVAALSTFLIGGLWYSPALFAKAWMEENGFTEENMKGRNMAKIFGTAFVLGLIASFNLAFFIGSEADMKTGALYGFLTGAGWVATFIGTHYIFENRSMRLFLINAGYSIVALTVMGMILGAWH